MKHYYRYVLFQRKYLLEFLGSLKLKISLSKRNKLQPDKPSNEPK